MKLNGERVILNVRGRKFETTKETFQRIPESRLYKLLTKSVNMEYYFDRNSILFEYILDVYKTGSLHVPSHLCGGLLKQEMQYWGIPLHYIADCCLKNYSSYLDELRIIKEIGKAFANDYDEEPPSRTPYKEPVYDQNESGVYFNNESFESEDDTFTTPVKDNNNGNELLRKAIEQNRQSLNDEIQKNTLQTENVPKQEVPTTSEQVTIEIVSENSEKQDKVHVKFEKNNITSSASSQELNGHSSEGASSSTVHKGEAVFSGGKTTVNKDNILKGSSTKVAVNQNTFKAARGTMKQRKVMTPRAKLRMFLEDPFSSKLAFAWGWVFLCIVILSVVIQCSSSHPGFRRLIITETEYSHTINTSCQENITQQTTTTDINNNVNPKHTNPEEYQPQNGQPNTTQNWLANNETSTTQRQRIVAENELQTVSIPNSSSNKLTNSEKAKSSCSKNIKTVQTTKSPVLDGINEKEKMYLTTDLLPVLKYIQRCCVGIFTFELLLRLAVSVNKKRFIKNVYNIVDLLALVPTAILEIMDLIGSEPSNKQHNFKFVFYLGTMGVFKTLRLVKFIRHYRAMKILLLALKASIQEILLLFLLISIGMLIFSTLIYYTEFYTDSFETIPKGFWWSIVTMTTVGYGDIYPTTEWGYLVGTMCALAGMLSTGLPIPIIANNFNIYYTYAKVHTCKIEIAAQNNNMKFSKVVRLIGRMSTTIKRRGESHKMPKDHGSPHKQIKDTKSGHNNEDKTH